jgi:hypothetical protein
MAAVASSRVGKILKTEIRRETMEKTMLEPGTVIGNVNVLDLRKATAETLADIARIGNVNILLYSQATAPLIRKLNLGNINVSVEAPEDAQVVTGQVIISREYFQAREQPVFLVVTGQVLVKPDVAPEDVEKGLDGLVVVGQIVCPEPVLGTLQAKTKQLVGQSMAYPPGGRLITGSLVMDEAFLKGLEGKADLVVLGSLRMPRAVSNDLLAQKLGKLYVTGGIRVHEENADAIQTHLSNGARKMTVVPAGYALVENPLVLDDTVLEALPASKLFCLERVQVEATTSPDVLDTRLAEIVAKDLLLCPSGLRAVMGRKCNILETQTIFYDGELWLVDGAEELSASRFEYLTGKATLVVTGALTLDSDLEPKVLADRLAKVHNQGVIKCTPEQRGAIQARLGLNEGLLGAVGEEGEAEEGIRRLANVNHLVL